MADIETQRKALRAKLDRVFEDTRSALLESLRQLDEQRQEGYKWIEDVPDFLIPIMLDQNLNASGLSLPLPANTPRNGDQSGTPEPFERVQLKEPIEKLIATRRDDQPITSLLLFDELVVSMPELKKEDAHKLKARIAATLGKLAGEQKIHIETQGGGSVPHVYKRGPAYKPMAQNFPTQVIK